MEIKIGERITKEKKNCYVLSIEYEHGDADAYTKKEIYFKKYEEPELIKVLTFLSALDEVYNHLLFDYENETDKELKWEKIFNEVFGYSYWSKENIYDLIEGDVTNDHDGTVLPYDYSVVYIDSEGFECEVNLID